MFSFLNTPISPTDYIPPWVGLFFLLVCYVFKCYYTFAFWVFVVSYNTDFSIASFFKHLNGCIIIIWAITPVVIFILQVCNCILIFCFYNSSLFLPVKPLGQLFKLLIYFYSVSFRVPFFKVAFQTWCVFYI